MTTVVLVITPLPFVVMFAVAFVVGTPPPAPPVANVTISPFAYPDPAVLISTVSTKPTPVLPPAVFDKCPAITQSRYATLAELLSPTKSVYIVIASSFSNVPILKLDPLPVPTVTTLAYVFESTPTINAAVF